jgi:hypothetical protein
VLKIGRAYVYPVRTPPVSELRAAPPSAITDIIDDSGRALKILPTASKSRGVD